MIQVTRLNRSLLIIFCSICCWLNADAQAPTFKLVNDSVGVDVTYSAIPTWGSGLSLRDFNGDGWDDLVLCTDQFSQIKIFENHFGYFQENAEIPISTQYDKYIVWIDFDNDGQLELFKVSFITGVSMFDIDTNGNWVDIASSIGLGNLNGVVRSGASFIDLNNDGLLDLILASHNQIVPNSIFFQTPNHNFDDISVTSGACDSLDFTFFAVAIDFNNDGWMDFYESNDGLTGNLMFQNNGDSTFTEVSHTNGSYYELNSMGLGIGDYDGDADFDIHITGHVNETILLKNDGNGFYTEVATQANVAYATGIGWGNTFFDADLDGDQDLYVSGIDLPFQGGSPSILHINNGTGYFVLDTLTGDSNYSFSNGIFDFNNDRLPDLAALNSANFQSSIWLNTSQITTPRFSIKLQGCTSNRDAIGAQIIAFDGNNKRIWMTHSNQSFLTQFSDRQIIPILNGNTLDSLRIIWPLGNDTVLYDIAPDQTIELIECGEAMPYPVILVDDYLEHQLVLCPNSSISLRLDGTYDDVLWSNGSTADSIVVTSPGTYDVTVTNQFGQTSASTKAVVVTAMPYPDISVAVQQPTCFNNGALAISAANNNYTYNWSNGSTSDSLFSLNPGNYTLTATNAGFCPIVQNFNLNGPDSLNPIMINLLFPDILCAGDSTEVEVIGSGGYGPFDYQWSNGAAGPIQLLPAGAYQITLTDPNGCREDTAFALAQPDPIFVWAESVADTNAMGLGKAWVEIDGGTPPYSIHWNDNLMQTTDTAFNLVSGDYTVQVNDSKLCSFERSLRVRNHALIGILTQTNTDRFSCSTSGDLFFISSESGIAIDKVVVFNSSGQAVSFTQHKTSNHSTRISIETPGVYVLKVNDSFTCRLIRW